MSTYSPDALIEAYAQVSTANQRALDQLAIVLAQFREHGIDCLLLKGADVLSRLYGVWGMRPFTDVDLLVREKDLPVIDRLVGELGYEPFITGNPAYRAPDHSLFLDLSTEIWYTDETEGIWRRAVQRHLGRIPVKAMSPEDLVIYLTAYVVLYRGSFSPAYPKDLALLVKKEPPDWDFILEEAGRCNLKIPLAHGLSYAATAESVPVPDRVWRALAPSSASEACLMAVLRRLVTSVPLYDIGHLLLLLTRPTGTKISWVMHYVFPSPTFLRYRYGGQALAKPIRTRLFRVAHLMVRAATLSGQALWRMLKPASLSRVTPH